MKLGDVGMDGLLVVGPATNERGHGSMLMGVDADG